MNGETLFECEVIESGYVAGEPHEKGEKLTLTARQKETGLRRGRIKPLGQAKDLEEEPEGEEPKRDPRDALKAKLDQLGVEYRANASAKTLQKLIDENDPLA